MRARSAIWRRESPPVLSPITRPVTSTSGLPEKRGYSDRSGRTKRSISPPCHVRHASPTALITPIVAARSPSSSRATASTIAPTRSASGDGELQRRAGVLDAQQREVGRRIAAHDRRALGLAAGAHDLDLVALERVIGGQDQIRAGCRTRSSRARRAFDRDDARGDALDGRRDVVGERDQRAGFGSHDRILRRNGDPPHHPIG